MAEARNLFANFFNFIVYLLYTCHFYVTSQPKEVESQAVKKIDGKDKLKQKKSYLERQRINRKDQRQLEKDRSSFNENSSSLGHSA